MTLRRIAALAALALASAAGPAYPAQTQDPWGALRRPLRLHPLPAGARCPVTGSHALDRGRLAGLGAGPAYPMPSRFDAYSGHPGWLGSKTLWAWPTTLIAHPTRVLVRGVRLDRPGVMRFQLGPDWETTPFTRELRIDTSDVVGSFSPSRWGATVTMLLVRSPGCYGLQLDSPRGTATVVVDAR